MPAQEKLVISTSCVIGRIQPDLVPRIDAASGFICYTIMQTDDSNLLSTRLFRDFAAMDVAP